MVQVDLASKAFSETGVTLSGHCKNTVDLAKRLFKRGLNETQVAQGEILMELRDKNIRKYREDTWDYTERLVAYSYYYNVRVNDKN